MFADLLKVEHKQKIEEEQNLDNVEKKQQDEQKLQQEKDRKEEEQEERAEVKIAAAATAFTFFKAQYDSLKGKHPDAIFLFKADSFYESFLQDAEKTSKILGITLSKKDYENGNGVEQIPYTHFPSAALDLNLPKLIRAGERVAICDPLEQNLAKVNEMVIPTQTQENNEQENKEEEQHHLKR